MNKLREELDDVIVHLSDIKNQQIKFANNTISATKTYHATDIGIFGAKDSRIVLTSLNDLSEEGIAKVIGKIKKFVSAQEKNMEYKGIAKGPFKYKNIPELYDKKIEDLEESAVDLVDKGIHAACDAGAKRTAGILESTCFKNYMVTSNDVEATDKGTSIYFSIRAFTDKDASGHMFDVSRVLNKCDIEGTARKAADTAVRAKNPIKGKVGKFDVLFGQLPFANMLDNLARGFSIFSVEAGLSCLSGRLGKKVANDNVTIYDDGVLPNGLNSSMFDDEGVPRQKTQVIKEGILQKYLHNTSTALRHNTVSTGNAGLISPEPTNTVFEEGDTKFDEMISGIKKGIYVTNVWYTRFQNHHTGDFSTIPRDGLFYIENGEIKHAIKDIRISENLLNVLQNVSVIGNDTVQIKGWEVELPIITPSVLVKNVNITKPIE